MVTRGKTINHRNPQRIEVDLSKQSYQLLLVQLAPLETKDMKHEHLLCFMANIKVST